MYGAAPDSTLTLDYSERNPSYDGVGFLPSAGTYPILGSCGFGMQLAGPISGDFLLTNPCGLGVLHCPGTPLPFGATKLTGSATAPVSNATSNWTLTA